jgi:hypothetical protein
MSGPVNSSKAAWSFYSALNSPPYTNPEELYFNDGYGFGAKITAGWVGTLEPAYRHKIITLS